LILLNEQATAKLSVLPQARLEPDLWGIVDGFGASSASAFPDIGAFFADHDSLRAMIFARSREGRILDYNHDSFDERIAMITRRSLLLTATTGLLAGAITHRASGAQSSSSDPVAIINAVYMRAAKGKGDGGGAFIIENDAAKAKYLSRSLVALWARADAHTPKGDVGPIDFDPVTNSQDPDVKSFKVVAEKLEADKAVIAVTITGRTARAKPSDEIVRYNFVRDDGKWKIDDISGTGDGEAWSIRDLLSESLKELT
jgi:hypothetical protein